MSKNEKIWLSPPHMCGEEMKYIQSAFNKNWIAPFGDNITVFQQDIASYLGSSSNVTVLSSGTAAIHLSLVLAGVKENDKVLCQSFTFCGSVNPILYQKAEPIFVDSEKETWNVCPDLLQEAIETEIKKGKKPKAFILVHLYGMPAKLKEIQAICAQYNIVLIEDAAEAFGSEYNGEKCGTFGDYAILSFNGNKIITTSCGGALVCKEPAQSKKATFLSSQAKDEAPHYQHSQLGYNYQMSNVLAGIGIGQMTVLEKRIEQKREIQNRYKQLFANKPFHFLKEQSGHSSNCWLSTVKAEKETDIVKLIKAFKEDNIECRPTWKPMHLQPLFAKNTSYLNNVSENVFNKAICLPSGTSMGDTEWERIEKVIDKN